MNTIPIPHNLKSCFNVNVNASDQNNVLGTMKCICGCDEFYVQYFGDLSQHFIDHYVLKTILFDNEYVIYVKAVCAKCKREYTVFNSLTDGYDSFTRSRKNIDLQAMKPFSCKKCKKDVFQTFITLEYSDKQEIMEDVGEDFEFENAFSWITVDLECKSCFKKYYKFIDYETS